MNDRLLRFYMGMEPDHRGRLFGEMLRQDDLWMEMTHDFIQWWFPLSDLSRASRDAPLLDAATAKVFRQDEQLRGNLRAAVGRMLKFLGLKFNGAALEPAENWSSRRCEWFTENTHNSLRITRMLKAMRSLGLEADACALAAGLEQLCELETGCGVSVESRRFWAAAVG